MWMNRQKWDLPWLHQVCRELLVGFRGLISHNTSPINNIVLHHLILMLEQLRGKYLKFWNTIPDVRKHSCFNSLGYTAGTTRMTGRPPPCPRRPPALRPGWCNRRWSLAWAWQRACNYPAPPGAGRAPWTRYRGWSRPQPASGFAWWQGWRSGQILKRGKSYYSCSCITCSRLTYHISCTGNVWN